MQPTKVVCVTNILDMTTEIETTQKHMEALRALSAVTMKISEAKNSLVKLQETETEYFVSREKKALDRIQKVLDDSHSLIEQANQNYDSIEEFVKLVTAGADLLAEALEKFEALSVRRDEYYVLRNKDLDHREETIASLMKGIRIKEEGIAAGKKQVEMGNKKLREGNKKLQDDRDTLDRAIARLKDGRI